MRALIDIQANEVKWFLEQSIEASHLSLLQRFHTQIESISIWKDFSTLRLATIKNRFFLAILKMCFSRSFCLQYNDHRKKQPKERTGREKKEVKSSLCRLLLASSPTSSSSPTASTRLKLRIVTSVILNSHLGNSTSQIAPIRFSSSFTLLFSQYKSIFLMTIQMLHGIHWIFFQSFLCSYNSLFSRPTDENKKKATPR